jgi:hypothetical protein
MNRDRLPRPIGFVALICFISGFVVAARLSMGRAQIARDNERAISEQYKLIVLLRAKNFKLIKQLAMEGTRDSKAVNPDSHSPHPTRETFASVGRSASSAR